MRERKHGGTRWQALPLFTLARQLQPYRRTRSPWEPMFSARTCGIPAAVICPAPALTCPQPDDFTPAR